MINFWIGLLREIWDTQFLVGVDGWMGWRTPQAGVDINMEVPTLTV